MTQGEEGIPAQPQAVTRRSLTSLLPPALLMALGITIAALGQAVSTREVPDWFSVFIPFADRLAPVYARPERVAAAILLLVVGALVFVVGAHLLRNGAHERFSSITLPSPLTRVNRDYIALAGLAAGMVVFAYAYYRLYNDNYQHTFGLLVLASLLLVAGAFFRYDLRRRVLSWPRPRWTALLEVGFVVAVIAIFIALNVRDLTSWKYAAVGDEYGNFEWARWIARGMPFNPFWQKGAGDLQSVLTSAGQAVFLKLFGEDIFAWKLHLVVFAAAAFVPLYLLLRELFSRRVALFALPILASSHYLFGYTHHPNYADAFLPEALSLWLLALGLRKNSTLALFASGAAAGMGFYSYYTGRVIVVIIAIYLLTFGRRMLRPNVILPLAAAFTIVVGPLFAVNRWYEIHAMFGQSAIEYSSTIVGSRTTRFLHNIVLSLMAFNYSDFGRHYVWGSLLDPISAVLYVPGLGLAISKIRNPAYRLLVVWWGVGLAACGFTNPYPGVAVTRLHFLLLPIAGLCALTLDKALQIADGLWRSPALRTGLASVVLVGVAVPVLALNLHRFWVETPTRFGTPTVEAVAVRAIFSDTCRDRLPAVSVIMYSPGPLLAKVLDAYNLGDRMPTLYAYEDALKAFPAGKERPAGLKDDCVIFIGHTEEQNLQTELLARLHTLYADKQWDQVTDLSGLQKVTLIH
jgi:hypothetical protein